MNKDELLQKEAEKIAKCKECQKDKIGKPVPGEGNPNAQIVFIGEAPGKTESQTGRPFIGRSGKFLRQLINQIGLKEDKVYITSPVKYLPKRGTPSESEIAHGRIHLIKQLSIIKPKLIVLLGNVAYRALIQEPPSIYKYHAEVIEKDKQKYFPTFHPAAAIRFKKIKTLIENDFQILKKLIFSAKM